MGSVSGKVLPTVRRPHRRTARTSSTTPTTATTCSTSPRSRTPSTTACCASSRSSKPRIRNWPRPIRRPSASAPRRRRSFAEVRHAVPMLSLANAFSDEEVRDFRAPHRRAPGPRRAVVLGRAEARRPRDQPALRGRRASCGRHARRRRHRRGRHRQPAHDQGDPAAPARQRLAARARSARRGVHAARRVRGIQRAGARARRQGAGQSAQRRGRLAAPARSARSPRSVRWRSTPTASAWSKAASCRRRIRQTLAQLARVGLAGQRRWSKSRRAPKACSTYYRAHRREARRPAVRHRRRGLQARRLRRPARDGFRRRARRAGRSRTSSRRRSRRPRSRRSRSTSAAPAR